MKLWKKAAIVLLGLAAVYLLVIVAEVIWAFQVKLNQWPVYVYGMPYTVRAGDQVGSIRLLDRLSRLGYVQSPVLVPNPGQWNRSGSSLDVNLKHCPVKGLGIVSGPVSFSMDDDRIRSIHLTRSLEDIDRVVLEPELIHVMPAAGWGAVLCREVALDEIPPLLVDAIVLTEDRHFFSHPGIDVDNIYLALKANYRARRYVQGASTITQQLIRMTLLTPKKTIPRKIHEVALSITAELLYSKRAILEAYLNRVYFGHWGQYPVHGVQSAATHLFGKSLKQLDASECALMAASIMAPNVITPRRHLDRTRSRRNMVLGLLLKEGRISRDEYDQGLAEEPTILAPGSGPVKAPAFVEMVEDAISGGLGWVGIEDRDLITSLDPVLQNAVNHELKQLGQAGPEAHLIVSNPGTGEIRALVNPGPQKWDGRGGSLRSLLPLVMIPALQPEKGGQARFTLTSQVFSPQSSVGSVTLRDAFVRDRDLLLGRILERVSEEQVVSILKEFSVRARSNSPAEVVVEPMTPLKMAQSYSILAGGGRARAMGPGIRIPDRSGTGNATTTYEAPYSPAVLFLVNHLMKRLQPAEERYLGPDRVRYQPSVFVEEDKEGLWGIAYRSDMLLLVRIRDVGFDRSQVLGMMLRVLPPMRADSERPPPVPDGVLFRKTCVDSGLRATSTCPDAVPEPYLKGTQPSEWCPVRHEVKPLRTHIR